MRLLVDTSVWVDYFRGNNTRQVEKLDRAVRQGDDLCCCGFVLTEVLQGVQNDQEHDRVKRFLGKLIYLRDDSQTFELAAKIFRELRRHGITVRSTMDCLIAAVVVQQGVRILENDRDFKRIDEYYPLGRL